MQIKKIAILTQPLSTNYGGILQAYALQIILKQMKHKVVTINRKPNSYSQIKLTLSRIKNKILNKIKGNDKFLFSAKDMQFIAQHSTKFIKNNISLTELIDDDSKLIKHFDKNKYDAVVVGSDQTWRPKYSPNIFNFYLDFLKDKETKRIAYASSFGVDNWEYTFEETEKCKMLLQKFNAVSVREKSGINLCKQHLNSAAELVLDPTMLLDKQHYIKLFKSKNIEKAEGKLYTYVLDRNIEKNQIIEKVVKELNISEFKNQPIESLMTPNGNSLEDYIYPPVEGWIKGFYDAEFIITDSFHGTIFSILFNKPFISVPNKERGVDRFTSILKQLGLEHRMVFNSEHITDVLLKEKINFNDVNVKLENLRVRSLNFLKESV